MAINSSFNAYAQAHQAKVMQSMANRPNHLAQYNLDKIVRQYTAAINSAQTSNDVKYLTETLESLLSKHNKDLSFAKDINPIAKDIVNPAAKNIAKPIKNDINQIQYHHLPWEPDYKGPDKVAAPPAADGAAAPKNANTDVANKDPNNPGVANNGGEKDPYEVNINGSKYIFVQDKNNDGKTNNETEFLGYTDTKDSLFKGMKDLDSNKDGKVDSAEMKAANVKLAKVDENGKITNETFNQVGSVDLNSFKANANFTGQGNAGSFNLTLNNGQTVKGKEVFEDEAKLKSYFTNNPFI